jgi:hypothetical protein
MWPPKITYTKRLYQFISLIQLTAYMFRHPNLFDLHTSNSRWAVYIKFLVIEYLTLST